MHVYASAINPNPNNLENRLHKNQNQSNNSNNNKPHHHPSTTGEGLGSTINLYTTKTTISTGEKNNNNLKDFYKESENRSEYEGRDIPKNIYTKKDQASDEMSGSSYPYSNSSMYNGGGASTNLHSNNQSTTTNSWENVRREVRIIESKLETKIQSYSWLSTKISGGGNSGELLHDEENPLLESEEEANLANEIEDLLATLSDCNERMGTMVKIGAQGSNSALLQRYREILFDFSSEYKKINQIFQRNRETAELFRNRQNSSIRQQSLFSSESNSHNVNKNGDQENTQHGSAMELLMQERRGISSSIRSVSSIISQALEITDNLTAQRESITNSTGRMGNVNTGLPSINRMVGIIQQKKTRDNVIIGSLIGFCICFSLWYCFG